MDNSGASMPKEHEAATPCRQSGASPLEKGCGYGLPDQEETTGSARNVVDVLVCAEYYQRPSIIKPQGLPCLKDTSSREAVLSTSLPQ